MKTTGPMFVRIEVLEAEAKTGVLRLPEYYIQVASISALIYILSIFVPPSQSNDIAKKSASKPKSGHESTTGIHLIN